MRKVAMTVFRLLVYPGNTKINNLNPPSERAMGYIGFHCISIDRLSFFNTPFTLQCVFFLFRAQAGFIIAQLKTLSISGAVKAKNNSLMSLMNLKMVVVVFFFVKVVLPSKVQERLS